MEEDHQGQHAGEDDARGDRPVGVAEDHLGDLVAVAVGDDHRHVDDDEDDVDDEPPEVHGADDLPAAQRLG